MLSGSSLPLRHSLGRSQSDLQKIGGLTVETPPMIGTIPLYPLAYPSIDLLLLTIYVLLLDIGLRSFLGDNGTPFDNGTCRTEAG
jgi:hypothetical protein